jgi:Leucine-rich repeat (LRR) protein
MNLWGFFFVMFYFSLEHCRHLDLRMNQIRFDDNDLVLLNQLIYLTYLDVSHNHRINELDLRLLNNLEYLHCSYNNTTRLILNGHSLKQLNASHNSKILNYFLLTHSVPPIFDCVSRDF